MVIQLLMIFLGIIGAAFGAYFVYTCAFGLFLPRKKKSKSAPPVRRIAAVIAARNEEAVVGQLVESLMKQKYPRELFDVYVVPNNCTDKTEEVAREAGAKIISCRGPISSKGDALRCAFSYLTSLKNRYDAYCIFDADNLADEMFFQAVNDIREEGIRVAQGYRDSKNPFYNWTSGCMSVFYWFMSRFYNSSRAALGMSAALNGTGFMVADDVIREIGWQTVTLTEDLEFSALCALNDIKIGWMPLGRFYDEQPQTFRDSVNQRRRWSAGSLQCFKRYARQLFAHRTAHSFDMGILFTGMLMNLVGALSMILAVILFIRGAAASPESLPGMLLAAGISVAASWLGMSLGCAAMYALEKKLTWRALPAILTFGVFMLTWMPINISCFFTKPPKWDAIRHTGGQTLDI